MAANDGFWVLYDLGLKGDYDSLYRYLDANNAIECGDNLAFIRRDYGRNFLATFRAELIEQGVNLTDNDRIYVLFSKKETGQFCGYFAQGRRKRSPWEGYAVKGGPEEGDTISDPSPNA
jgi:hypothetical protein